VSQQLMVKGIELWNDQCCQIGWPDRVLLSTYSVVWNI